MRRYGLWTLVVGAVLASLLPACDGASGDAEADVGRDPAVDAGGEGDADVGLDGDARDGDAIDADDAPACDSDARALTFVVSAVTFVTDRLCDLDGDGVDDNSTADLGPTDGPLFAGVLSSIAQALLDAGQRTVVHLPLVDDPVTPEDDDVTVIFFDGADEDVPPNLLDDFSGREPFRVVPESVDDCGEPAFWSAASLTAGALVAEGGTIPVPLGAPPPAAGSATVTGSSSRCGAAAELAICAVLSARAIGHTQARPELGDGSDLEAFLAGGESLGLHIPGLALDVDLDGDGLERFEMDEEGHIAACIDGDTTVIPGRDCWQDERMADGFSMNMRLELTSAAFAGRPRGWESAASYTCDDWPLESSLFDPR